MKIKKCVETESGQILTHEDDGFIVQGCIFSSNLNEDGFPYGGVVGDGKTAEKLVDNDIPYHAYTVEEFIRALNIDPYVLTQIAKKMVNEKPSTLGVLNRESF